MRSVLYKEAEKQKIKVKVDKLQEKFQKFEKGEIKPEELKDFIQKVIHKFKIINLNYFKNNRTSEFKQQRK
jgi:hypothetical protein